MRTVGPGGQTHIAGIRGWAGETRRGVRAETRLASPGM